MLPGSEVDPKNERHWLLAVVLQLGLRVRYLYESWFFIRPLFMGLSAYQSNFRPKNAPDFDFITIWGFTWIWVLAGFTRDGSSILYGILCKIGIMSLINNLHGWLSDRLAAQFEKAGFHGNEREVPIPEYDWKNGNPQEFYNLFVKKPHPVILRGFMNDTQLLKDLSWDTIISKYGDEDVFLTRRELDGYAGKLKEVENPQVYLHNSEKLFNKYPIIRTLFQYKKLEPYLQMKVGYEQLFVGKQGTGTPFHNAAVYNMFYMIDGQKKWWFVDPYDTFLAYPIVLFGRAASVIGCLFPIDYNKEAFPLFKYCPVYTAVVSPGDVLFNPPWWWHAVKNVTPVTAAVASRWHTGGIVGGTCLGSEEDYDVYRFGSFAFLNGLASWKFLHGILQEPSPKFDEHTTLRETNNRFVHKQIKVADQGGVEVMGVKTKF